MDEKKEFKLKVLEKTEEEVEIKEAISSKPTFTHQNQTNPMLKHLGRFRNEQIGNGFSIRDLLR